MQISEQESGVFTTEFPGIYLFSISERLKISSDKCGNYKNLQYAYTLLVKSSAQLSELKLWNQGRIRCFVFVV